MPKKFNVTGVCIPEKNYMVDISERIDTIVTDYIEEGKYFTINRARQYGKTTTLYLLERRLKENYVVIRLSFEASDEMFVSLYTLAAGLVRRIGRILKAQKAEQSVLENWNQPVSEQFPLDDLSERIAELCSSSDKGTILIIDEVDKSSDNQVFLSFLGLLRNKYLEQMQGNDHTFQSVILAGVYDIKNLKIKLRPGEETKYNSPWNIAEDFDVTMSFSSHQIAAMLEEYEADHQTGMDVPNVSRLVYDYTSGYPYLVSRICQLADERLVGAEEFPDRKSVWTRKGISAAELLLRQEPSTLFDDMLKKLADYPELKRMLENILFSGDAYSFNQKNNLIDLGSTFGFIKGKNGFAIISNRIFETELYNLFLSEMETNDSISQQSSMERNQYIAGGMLQMRIVMEKFYKHFTEIYSGSDERFIEEQGRKIFLLYLKPIINGTGNYYIEAQTRDRKRTDIIVDYRGRQFIIELKLWHGNEYNSRGEAQLLDYQDYYKIDTGYMVSSILTRIKEREFRKLICMENIFWR